MDILEKDILNSISVIREKSKKPDAEYIFKHSSSTGGTNSTMQNVEESIKLLFTKYEVVNRKSKQGLDSFFIVYCQLEIEVVYKKAHLLKQLVCQDKLSVRTRD